MMNIHVSEQSHTIRVSWKDIEALIAAAPQGMSEMRRISVKTAEALPLIESFTVCKDISGQPISRLATQDLSLHLLHGQVEIHSFDSTGRQFELVSLSDNMPCKTISCRIPKRTYHEIVVRSAMAVLLEATQGDKAVSDMATATRKVQSRYKSNRTQGCDVIENRVDNARDFQQFAAGIARRWHREHAKVYVSLKSISTFNESDVELLCDKLRTDGLDRVRMCAHQSGEDDLHDMLMVFDRSSYIRPSHHHRKDESLVIIDGEATYYAFNQDGEITEKIHLGSKNSGKPFYCRIPANKFHCLVPGSRLVVAKEVTTGPFRREETLFARWSPTEDDQKDVTAFLSRLP